jgi:hypothetical protein
MMFSFALFEKKYGLIRTVDSDQLERRDSAMSLCLVWRLVEASHEVLQQNAITQAAIG